MRSASTLVAILAKSSLILIACLLPALPAQDAPRANWALAEKFSAANLRKFIYSTRIDPNWVGKSDRFWYSFKTSAGTRYWLVDAEARSKRPLFDHDALGTALSITTRKPVHAAQLELSQLKVDDPLAKLEFVSQQRRFAFELATGTLTDLGPAPRRPPSGRGPAGEQRDEQRRERGQREQQQEQQEQQDQQDQQQQDEQEQVEQQGDRQGQVPRRGARSSRSLPRAVSPDGSASCFVREHDLYFVEGTQIEEPPAPAAAAEKAPAAGGGNGETHNGDLTKAEPPKPADAASVPAPPRRPRFRFDDSAALRLTADSAEGYSFAPTPTQGRESRQQTQPRAPVGRLSATWSKDSRALFATRRDTRPVRELYLVDSLAQPRPALQKYPYSMPGEDTIARTELWVFDRASKQLRKVARKWTDETYLNVHFLGEGHELRFVRRDRLQRNAELCALDPATGAVRVLLAEAIEDASLALQNVRYLDKRGQFLWWSERSGWGHYYLHDAQTGALVTEVTRGPWRAGTIVDVDEERAVLWFRGNCREPGENIYHEHLYRIDLDGSDLICLDEGDALHRSTLSPSRRFVVDSSSRVDLAPVSVLRDGENGNLLLTLEQADMSKLEEMGWRMPERFMVKAADGVTDLYGNLWKPFDFDAGKRYPIIVNVYPGPQQEGVTHSFSAASTNQQLAQLGFLVVQVGHRGGTPARDKAYGAFGYGNLRDYGLEDKKCALEQLADRHPYVDLQRVGIFGHSGGGFMTAAALLREPYNRFFKVGVASAGNHDNNIYNANWSERWHGLTEAEAREAQKQLEATQDGTKAKAGTEAERNGDGSSAGSKASGADAQEAPKFEIQVPTNAELAANLQGKLLLVHGELDNNVHPANTMRLVDALIRANKRFDMLLIPGARHSFGHASDYFRHRMFEYFADHLLGCAQREPPPIWR